MANFRIMPTRDKPPSLGDVLERVAQHLTGFAPPGTPRAILRPSVTLHRHGTGEYIEAICDDESAIRDWGNASPHFKIIGDRSGSVQLMLGRVGEAHRRNWAKNIAEIPKYAAFREQIKEYVSIGYDWLVDTRGGGLSAYPLVGVVAVSFAELTGGVIDSTEFGVEDLPAEASEFMTWYQEPLMAKAPQTREQVEYGLARLHEAWRQAFESTNDSDPSARLGEIRGDGGGREGGSER